MPGCDLDPLRAAKALQEEGFGLLKGLLPKTGRLTRDSRLRTTRAIR